MKVELIGIVAILMFSVILMPASLRQALAFSVSDRLDGQDRFVLLVLGKDQLNKIHNPGKRLESSKTELRATASTPSPNPTPIPYPTPVVNLRRFTHLQGGPAIEISADAAADVGKLITDADTRLGTKAGLIRLKCRGDVCHFKSEVTLSHDLVLEGTFAFGTKNLWSGAIIPKSNVKIKGNATLLEPDYAEGRFPAITIFQAFDSHEGRVDNVTIQGLRIVGRQKVTDGGIRQSIALGNCHNCAVLDCDLSGVSSIGIQVGGSSAKGNHAENVVIANNKISRNVAAGIAIVNAKDVYVYGNEILAPGRAHGPGGVSGVDIETNSDSDWCENLKIYNNSINYEGSELRFAGNAINAQNVAHKNLMSRGLLIANNLLTGGSPFEPNTSMSNGLFFNGPFPGGLVVSNYIETASQCGMQIFATRDTEFRGNILRNVGGSGPAIYLWQATNNRFVDNQILRDKNVRVITSVEIRQDMQSVGNVFQGNNVEPVREKPKQ